MKKVILSVLALTSLTIVNAQETEKEKRVDYDRWSIEANVGVNKAMSMWGVNFNEGYNNGVGFRHYDLGVRYMLSSKFGLKLDVGYDTFNESSGPAYDADMLRFGLQGVVNLGRVLDFEDWTNTIGLLAHAGGAIGSYNTDYKDDKVVSAIAGLTLQFKLSERFAVTLDGTAINNFGQNQTFNGGPRDVKYITVTATAPGGSYPGTGTATIDGHTGDVNITVVVPDQTVTASAVDPSAKYFKMLAPILNASVGVTYYFGKKTHADWYLEDNKTNDELDSLESRIAELEAMLVDSDKDGVPDYLDAEPNSVPGVAVDTKGRTVDTNGNGVPDELESYFENKYGSAITKLEGEKAKEAEAVLDLINKGYVTTYFDFNKTQPTNVSTHGIDFIRTYLINNPDKSVDIFGHADEIGSEKYNYTLANKRAESVKDILVKAGIDASRLNVVSRGEDKSVEPSSVGARKLVRRVTFQVK
ncbi:MAG: OmpA family protein [Flavobacteriaceae bacterium]